MRGLRAASGAETVVRFSPSSGASRHLLPQGEKGSTPGCCVHPAHPVLRSPAAMPLIASKIPTRALASIWPARQRRKSSACRWFNGAI